MTRARMLSIALLSTSGLSIVNAQDATPVTDPQFIVKTMEGTFGVHPGFRRAHAKGICASGYFEGTPEGATLSKATVFKGDKIPVIARYSVGGGNPNISDKAKSVRGLALKFSLPNDEQWLMANISAPVFFVATPEKVAPFFASRKPDPATGKPDPQRVAAFNSANPDTKPQIDYVGSRGVPASYAALSYFGVNAFRVTDEAGIERHVRWAFEPVNGEETLTDAQLSGKPDAFLGDDLRKRVAADKIAYHFYLQIAEQGDNLVDPTQVWPKSRKRVLAGTLTIDAVTGEGESGACDEINFNPLVLPKGIAASDDPILRARVAPYALSHAKRLGGR